MAQLLLYGGHMEDPEESQKPREVALAMTKGTRLVAVGERRICFVD